MDPVSVCGPVACAARGLACCEQAVKTSTRATRALNRTRLDVRVTLATINCYTGAGDEARLARAHIRHDARDLIWGSESPERHLLAYELGDSFRIGLPAAVPASPFPHDRTPRDRLDRDPSRRHLPRPRLHHADLRRLGPARGRPATRLAAPHRPE